MIDQEFESILQLKIQEITNLILVDHRHNFVSALNYLYSSKLYESLSDESTKLWHLSPEKLVDMLKMEKKSNELIYPDFV